MSGLATIQAEPQSWTVGRLQREAVLIENHLAIFAEHHREGRPEPPSGTTCLLLLHCCVDVVEGRDDRLKRLNTRRSIDRLRQRLQHFRVDAGVVIVGVALVLPQTD